MYFEKFHFPCGKRSGYFPVICHPRLDLGSVLLVAVCLSAEASPNAGKQQDDKESIQFVFRNEVSMRDANSKRRRVAVSDAASGGTEAIRPEMAEHPSQSQCHL